MEKARQVLGTNSVKIEKVFIDGKILDADQANPKIGKGVFETFRVSKGKAFLLEDHFSRLHKSLKALNVSLVNEAKTKNNIREIAAQAKEDAYIRMVVDNYQTVIFMASIPGFSAKAASAQILNSVTHHKPQHFDQIGFRLKDNEYLNFLSKNKQSKNGNGIMLDKNGFVAESLTANVFWSKGGKLHTSPLKMGILAGTFRNYLVNSNEVSETLIKAKELEDADEIFLTNGVKYIVPLNIINDIKKPGLNGPVFRKLYNDLAKSLNLTKQF